MALAERELKNYVNESVGVSLEQWITENRGLIESVAGKYDRRFRNIIAPFGFDDLFQIAAMSVIDSYNRFVKINDNVDFTKYAVHYMHFKVDRFCNFKARSIHVPLLQRGKGKDKVLSLNFKVKDEKRDDEIEFGELALRPELMDFEQIYVNEFIDSLNERQKTVIRLRLEGKWLSEIGEVIGASGETARNVVLQIAKAWVEWSGVNVKKAEKEIPIDSEDKKKWEAIAVSRGMNYKTYRSRLRRGYTPEEAATKELRKKGE